VIFNTLLVLVNGLVGMIFEHSQKNKNTLIIPYVGSHNYFNFVFTLHKSISPTTLSIYVKWHFFSHGQLFGGLHIWYRKCFII
jgi:hypothetical protein